MKSNGVCPEALLRRDHPVRHTAEEEDRTVTSTKVANSSSGSLQPELVRFSENHYAKYLHSFVHVPVDAFDVGVSDEEAWTNSFLWGPNPYSIHSPNRPLQRE